MLKHYRSTVALAVLTTITISQQVSYSQDKQAVENQDKPGKMGKIFKKLRHPFKSVHDKTQTPSKAGALIAPSSLDATTNVKEQSAVMTESPLGVVAPPKPNDVRTAGAMNDIPGVAASPALFETPQIDTSPIPWYAPIKKVTRPIENISKISVMLGQQIMRLEGPIASLQPSMLGLKDEMGNVQNRMGSMQGNLQGMQGSLKSVQGSMGAVGGQMGGVRSDLRNVGSQMESVRSDLGGVRADLGGMRRQIIALQAPIERLEGPINRVVSPVTSVQTQLEGVREELGDLKTLLSTVLASIYIAAAAIAFGTPLAAFLVYKNRRKIFPNTKEKDFPGSAQA